MNNENNIDTLKFMSKDTILNFMTIINVIDDNLTSLMRSKGASQVVEHILEVADTHNINTETINRIRRLHDMDGEDYYIASKINHYNIYLTNRNARAYDIIHNLIDHIKREIFNVRPDICG